MPQSDLRYEDGQSICVGDVLALGAKYSGTVVGIVQSQCYVPPLTHAQWGYLQSGILVDTDFGGLVHYPQVGLLLDESARLVRRRD